jgi:hypothetical protein
MMAMKGAFEAKLKIARDSAEATTARHRTEISRISSGTSLPKATNPFAR